MRYALVVLACAVTLLACRGRGGEGRPDGAARAARPVETTPAADSGDVVVDIDARYLLRATLTRDGATYTADVMDQRLEGEGFDAGADAHLDAWLARYAPLRAHGRAPGFVPDSLVLHPDAQVSFFFDDGSGRVVSFQRYGDRRAGDSLAVVARPDGPVYRLPADALDTLVPTAEVLER